MSEGNDSARIIELVEEYLEPFQPRSYRLEVQAKGIKRDGNWWYVVVHPTKPDVRASDYSSRLSKAEDALAKGTKIKVLLAPVEVD